MTTGKGRGTAVELVSIDGRAIGEAEKLTAHTPPGKLHRAISVLLLDGAGRLILQRRALTKYQAAGLWSNACCSHPWPREQPLDTARRRLTEELGITEMSILVPAGTTTYRVTDPGSGLVEHEFNHLFVGRTEQTLRPDAREVAELDTMPLEAALALQADDPVYAPWFVIVLRSARHDLAALRGGRLTVS
jgi:isopentenyl-diphosphate delta-isomerase